MTFRLPTDPPEAILRSYIGCRGVRGYSEALFAIDALVAERDRYRETLRKVAAITPNDAAGADAVLEVVQQHARETLAGKT